MEAQGGVCSRGQGQLARLVRRLQCCMVDRQETYLMSRNPFRLMATVLVVVAPVSAQLYHQANLVSDVPGLATITDPLLINPWGVSFSGSSPFWVSNAGSSTSTLYMVTASGDV